MPRSATPASSTVTALRQSALATALCALSTSAAHAQAPTTAFTANDLDETVLFVPYPKALFSAQLETTVYRPATPPPWPLVVINHGSKGYSDPHQQERNRPVETARFFVDRGYLAVAPMRQGFSKSTGVYAWNCDHTHYALRYAEDIKVVIDYFVSRGDARADQVLVVGQSNGGMVTLGYAASNPKAKGIINFAGGINSSRPGCDWKTGMVEAAGELGRRTQLPSLWIYTETDTIFPPDVSLPFFQAYQRTGTPTELKLFPKGGHAFSTTSYGRETWGPVVEKFLQQIGLPSAR